MWLKKGSKASLLVHVYLTTRKLCYKLSPCPSLFFLFLAQLLQSMKRNVMLAAQACQLRKTSETWTVFQLRYGETWAMLWLTGIDLNWIFGELFHCDTMYKGLQVLATVQHSEMRLQWWGLGCMADCTIVNSYPKCNRTLCTKVTCLCSFFWYPSFSLLL